MVLGIAAAMKSPTMWVLRDALERRQESEEAIDGHRGVALGAGR
jgi:hypothetical protein